MAWQVAKAVDVPVVGVGGIMTGEDALEFLCVGCRAVQVGTANFVDPQAPVRVAREIPAWLGQQNLTLAEVVGSFRPE
jgi:dihydroorotate dehydrogenase (NAD+) catalytic subunit